MNLDSMCIEEGLNPSPFHSKLEADFWESVSQSNKTVNTNLILTVKIWKCHLFTKMVKQNLSVKE